MKKLGSVLVRETSILRTSIRKSEGLCFGLSTINAPRTIPGRQPRAWYRPSHAGDRQQAPLNASFSNAVPHTTIQHDELLSSSDVAVASHSPVVPVARRRPSSGVDDGLQATTVRWLREQSTVTTANAMSWKHSDVAMARNLLERWLTVAAAEIHTEKTARFATLILKRWLNQRDSSDSDTRELMELFHRVLHLWQRSTSQKSPDKAVNLLQTFQTQSLLYEEPRLRPGPRAYSMVFQTLMKSADASYATKETAKQLIQQLQMQTLSPDTVVAQNSYLQFLGKKCGDVPEQAERFLRDEMVAPNEKSYAAVLQAWANSSDRPDRARRACDLLGEMMEKGMMNQVCINICLHALGNAGYGQRAEDLLWSMQR